MEPQRSMPPRDHADARERLFGIIRENSFFRRKITLVSGRESDFYFDMKPTMFDPEGAALLARLFLERLQGARVDYVGGLAVGAIPLIATVAARSHDDGRPIPGFFVRKEVKEHGTKRRIDGLPEGASLSGRTVVVLEDVTTTGGSAMLAVEASREAGANILQVLSIVDRQEGAADTYAKAGVPFGSLFTASEFLAA
jgi:orotate phosphoribosyltransferase